MTSPPFRFLYEPGHISRHTLRHAESHCPSNGSHLVTQCHITSSHYLSLLATAIPALPPILAAEGDGRQGVRATTCSFTRHTNIIIVLRARHQCHFHAAFSASYSSPMPPEALRPPVLSTLRRLPLLRPRR